MRQTKRVLKPWGLWDFSMIESWLEEEAANGWRLMDSVHNWTLKFERCEPMACRVRMESLEPEPQEARQERLEAYEEMGWECVTYLLDGWQYQVYYCTDPEAPELHTDPVARNWAWGKTLKGHLYMNLACMAALVLVWCMPLMLGDPLLETALKMTIAQYLLNVACIAAIVLMIQQTIRLWRALKQVKAEVEPALKGNLKKELRLQRFMSGVLLVVWLMIMLSPVAMRFSQNQRGYMGIVQAKDLITEDEGERNWEIGTFRRGGSVLANAWFELEEHNRKAAVNTIGYCLRFEGLAGVLYRNWYTNFLREFPVVEELTLEGDFEEGLLLSAEEQELLLLRQGKGVYAVRTENIELEPHVEDYSALLRSMVEKEG